MAVWLTAERTQPGPVFGNKGPYLHKNTLALISCLLYPLSADVFEGLGLFIDT